MELFIKICGITNLEDARLAVSYGANALGFMMYEKSPRKIAKEEVLEIIKELPEEVIPVMVFVNPTSIYVESCLEVSSRLIPQFHGNETPEFCSSFGRDFLKAMRVSGKEDLRTIFESYSKAWMLLLDSYQKNNFGGTGKTFEWQNLKGKELNKPYLLAGGLNPENVEKALSLVPCAGIDVSSGVESSPGKKDSKKVKKFIRTARNFNG